MAVANEINKELHRDPKCLLLGSMAPDMAKLIGETKVKSHFQDENNDLPNLERFLSKYKNNLKDDFVLGYYIHLYTDYIWFNVFMKEFMYKGSIRTIDGELVECNEKTYKEYIYNDYTNLNISLMDEYELPIDLFYEGLPYLENIITEIPMDRLGLIIDKTGEILYNAKLHKTLVFDMECIRKFISLSTDIILTNIKELDI